MPTRATTARRRSAPTTAPRPSTMRAKPVTMRTDEWTGLDDLARELQDARTTTGPPRITANTIIRVAIDGLLAYRSRLSGDTEEELRRTWLKFLARGRTPRRADDGPVRGAKTVMIRPDQWTALDELARQLHDARITKVRRITANTIIRVAIDGLLAHAPTLSGDNEDNLRKTWLAFLTTRAERP